MSYVGYVTQLKEVRPHSNADRLQIGTVFGSNVILSLDYKEGDVVIFFPSDGQLSEEFCKANNLIRILDADGNNIGGYLDENKRNITAIKLRGEKSDGLALPLSSLSPFGDISTLKVGDTIDIFNGTLICNKYIPRKQNSQKNVNFEKTKKLKKVKHFPFFHEHIDTKQLMYNLHEFKEGDICTITLKMHGTSVREAHTIKVTDVKPKWYERLSKRKGRQIKEWDVVAGSRRVVLDFDKDDKGYYGTHDFRKNWHDVIAPKLHKGENFYGECVGYISENTLVMPQGDNSKTKDKEFIKRFGNITEFTYGCGKGENKVYGYRMTKTDEDGNEVEYPTWYTKLRVEQMGLEFVPIFEQFIYTTEEDMLNRVNQYLDIEDPVGKTHIAEGVVVRIENRHSFTAYKIKGWYFKVLEGIIKDTSTAPDIEEEQEI